MKKTDRLPFTLILMLVTSLVLPQLTDAVAPANQFRGANLSIQHVDTQEKIDEWIEKAKRANLNALFVNIFYHYPLYASERFPVRHELFQEDFDVPGYLIEQCHKNGLEFHAMFVNGRLQPDASWFNEEWVVVDGEGEPDPNQHIDYTNPEVQEYQVAVMTEFAEMYPEADGIQFDYIRFSWRTEQPYTKNAREGFKRDHGVDPILLVRSPEEFDEEELDRLWAGWREWRMEKITEVVRRVGRELRAISPEMKLSASVLHRESWWSVACQNWPLWLNEGYLDFVKPMWYGGDASGYASRFDYYLSVAESDEARSRIIPSVAGGLRRDWPEALQDDPAQVARTVLDYTKMAEEKGLRGLNFFTLASMNEETVEALQSGPFRKRVPTYQPPRRRPLEDEPVPSPR